MPPDDKVALAALAAPLEKALQALGLALEGADRQRLLDYLALIAKWNRVYNLTAIRDPQQMLTQHVIDSLAIVRPLQRLLQGSDATVGPAATRTPSTPAAAPHGRTEQPDDTGTQHPALLDVGSGAGLPGIPLAIAWSALHVTMVEPVGKKAAFIQHAIGALRLTANASIAQCRVEQLRQSPLLTSSQGAAHPLRSQPPDLIVSRAFASLADFVRAVDTLAGPSTRIAAMKGLLPTEEIDDLPAGWRVDESQSLQVPGLRAQRHLILLSRSA